VGSRSRPLSIAEIADDTEGCFDDGWPTHPHDSDEEGDGERRLRTVYLGGAGVVHALDSLQRRGLVELRRDYVPYLETRYDADFGDFHHERSLWMGETGIRLVLQQLSPSQENADRLAQLIAGNAKDERRELMWGSPGTMLAAAAMHDLTGEARWLELWRESRLARSTSTGWWTSSSGLRTGSPAASSPCLAIPTTRFIVGRRRRWSDTPSRRTDLPIGHPVHPLRASRAIETG
jgi:hypothetical protein